MLSDEILKFLKENKIKYEEKKGAVFVKGNLNLRHVVSIPKSLFLIVEGNLNLFSLKSIPADFNLTVGGTLNLFFLKSIPEGFNPSVGGSLFLGRLESIPEGFNPTVGGDLYLERLKSINLNWIPKNVKGEIIVPDHLQSDLNYCLEMARIDSQFDFLPNK